MNFEFTEDQLAIRDLAAQIFSDAASDEALLALSRSGDSYDEDLWQVLAEQGLLGICLPDGLGGSDLGLTELCMILEEQGRYVAPVPLYSGVVLGVLPLIEFGSAEQQQRWLIPFSAGEIKLTAAIAELGMHPAIVEPVQARQSDGGWVLTGAVSSVPDGVVAQHVLLPVTHPDGQRSMMMLDTAADGVTVKGQVIGLLGEKAAHIDLENVQVDDSQRVGGVGRGDEILNWMEERANIGHSALQVGVSEEAIKRTAAYISEREQFGVPLGSFQALAMRMADSYIDVEAMRATYWLALWRLSNGIDAAAETRAAKWWACEGAHRIVLTAQHLHGGMGADVEYPIHRFFLWAKQISYSLGSASLQLEKLGAMLAQDDSQGFKALEV